jgi:hypothetical protein
MKPDTIETGAIPATAMDSSGLTENHDANLPNDLGKSRREKNHGWLW